MQRRWALREGGRRQENGCFLGDRLLQVACIKTPESGVRKQRIPLMLPEGHVIL